MPEPAVLPDGGLERVHAQVHADVHAPAHSDVLRVRLDLSYDGTDFSGWATQPARRTVQETLEEALGVVLRLPARPSLTVAGRTDAGVHARGQVAHVDLPRDAWEAVVGRSSDPPEEVLVTRLAGVLPPDVRVRRTAPAEPGFDARFAALSRRYAYRVATSAWGVDPLRRHEVLWANRPLDLERLAAASVSMTGVHDFAAYCRPRKGATTIRTLLELTWRETGDGVVEAWVEADAFCHSMVRALVGALLTVGQGRAPVEWPAQVLAGRERVSAVNVAPARGLTLELVRYPDAAGLARRAAESRRTRVLPAT